MVLYRCNLGDGFLCEKFIKFFGILKAFDGQKKTEKKIAIVMLGGNF